MLEFHQSDHDRESRPRRRSKMARRQSWRVWTLLLALGLVVLAMRQLQQPETADRLGQLFGASKQARVTTPEGAVEFESLADTTQDSALGETLESENQEASTKSLSSNEPDDQNPLAQIRDNTYFRPHESEAWFGLFEKLQRASDSELNDSTVGELTYAQMLKQPDYYRGKVVTIRGTVRREELQPAPENRLGIESYHRLWIEPVGGGKWPMVVYCLSLPKTFPRGDKLGAPISVEGYFFKNWSYPWSEGLGIAPVVLAEGVKWKKPTAGLPSAPPSDRSWLQAVLIASAVAVLVVSLAVRNTRRPKRVSGNEGKVQLPDSDTPVETVRQQLGRLAETESNP